MDSFFSGQNLLNLLIGLLEVQALSRVDCLTEEDMKSLCCLDNRADLSGANLKKGIVECGAEFTWADPSQVSAVHGGRAVRMELGLLAESLWIALQAVVQARYSAQERIFWQMRVVVLGADEDMTGAALFRKTK